MNLHGRLDKIKSGALVPASFLLVILLVFGSYVCYTAVDGSSSLPLQNPCASPLPPPPDNLTSSKNGTASGWTAVFIMPEDSKGQICIQYKANSNFDPLRPVIKSSNANGSKLLPSNLVNISASRSGTSNQQQIETAAFSIDSSEGSKGFYSATLFQYCEDIPIAVGYPRSALNLSDFSWALGGNYCSGVFYVPEIIGLTNVQVVYLPGVSNYIFNESSSVVSFNPSPNVQNVTLNLRFQTYATPINVSYSQGGSSIARYSSDPHLTRLPANDSCIWYPNNNQALGNVGVLPLVSTSSGNITVVAPSVFIPAYSTANFTLSIRLSNFPDNYYYTLNPLVLFTIGNRTDGDGGASRYPVTLGQSDFRGSWSEALSGPCTPTYQAVPRSVNITSSSFRFTRA